MSTERQRLLLTTSGELYIKSRRTARRFRRALLENLRTALDRRGVDARVEDDGHWITLLTDDERGAADAATSVFGVLRVSRVEPLPAEPLEDLVAAVAERCRERVRARTFAVRVQRSGTHSWSSPQAQRDIGTALLDASAGVDLDDPEVEVRVRAFDDTAYLVDRSREGPGGVPLTTQQPVLSLLSGGFDSPVAAWMLMRRGAPVDFLHFKLDCAQSDHALAVMHDLWRRWGAGTSPLVWVVDFQEVKEALLAGCPPRLRQVVLKQLMFAAADRLAAAEGIDVLVTGESVGQVSSQTLAHLAEIDRLVDRTVLRPLSGLDKTDIVDRAHRIGTAQLSGRAKEVCDLSEGPVAVAARRESLETARDGLPTDLVERALSAREVAAVEHWSPGHPLVPVVDRAPAGATLVTDEDALPDEGPVALSGTGRARTASRLLAEGREVTLLAPLPGGHPSPGVSASSSVTTSTPARWSAAAVTPSPATSAPANDPS